MKTATPAFLLVFYIATAAQSADIVRTPQASGPDFVTIAGKILEGDEQKFYKVTEDIRLDVIVILNSEGGSNNSAAKIGTRIKTLRWETRLHDGDTCNSACTLIFMGGFYRHMDKQARLGFHSAGIPGQRAEDENRKIAKWLDFWADAPQEIIDLQPKADPNDMNYVTYDMAKEWGILKPRPKSE